MGTHLGVYGPLTVELYFSAESKPIFSPLAVSKTESKNEHWEVSVNCGSPMVLLHLSIPTRAPVLFSIVTKKQNLCKKHHTRRPERDCRKPDRHK